MKVLITTTEIFVKGITTISHSLTRVLLLTILVPVIVANAHYVHPAVAASSFTDLEQDTSQWGMYSDQGMVSGALTLTPVQTQNDRAMQIALLSGQRYANLLAYDNLPSDNAAQLFRIDLSFYFATSQPVQALEFGMSTWVNNKRWEWAMQWQVIPASVDETAYTWRLWTGHSWLSLHVQQVLAPNAWHTLYLNGGIVHGKVMYQLFSCDTLTLPLSSYRFSPVRAVGDKLAVGVQLDGNAFEMPYHVYLHHVNFHAQ